MFKRRDRQGFWTRAWETVYPRGGWLRAISYMWHRLRRLPDTPHRIARGIGIGVFVCFTPFFGLHFVLAALLCWVMRGNVVAAILATFFGNPLTFPIIAAASMKLGGAMLGAGPTDHLGQGLAQVFWGAFKELGDNLLALFTPIDAHWGNLIAFFWEIFLPYLVGGLPLGVIFGLMAYRISAPVIEAYRNRRKGRLAKKWDDLRARAAARRAEEMSEDNNG